MWRAIFAPLFVAVIALASVAEATIMVPLSLEALTVRSRAVVRATVQTQQSVWDKEHKRIYTLTELTVTDVIHGDVPETIVVRTLGGEVDGIGMKVSGTARLLPQQDVVVFLRQDPMGTDSFMVVGMSQGLYRIERDSAGRVLAVPGVEGVAFARPGDDGVRRVDHRTEAVRMPYATLRARVVAVAAGQPAPVTPPVSPSPAAPTAPRSPTPIPQP